MQRRLSAADTGLCPYCVWQSTGKFHFHSVSGGYSWIPSRAFAHISMQCFSRISLPFPLPFMMLSAMNLCSVNPLGVQNLPHNIPLEETKGLMLLPCKWWEILSSIELVPLIYLVSSAESPLAQGLQLISPFFLWDTPVTSSPRPQFRRDLHYLSGFHFHYLSAIYDVSAKE